MNQPANERRYSLNIIAEIRGESGTNSSEYLRIDERVSVGTCGFMEICAILAQFHDLAGKLSREKKGPESAR